MHAVKVFNLDQIISLYTQRLIRLCFKSWLHKELLNTTKRTKMSDGIRRCENKRTELDRAISAGVENDPTRKHHLKVVRQLSLYCTTLILVYDLLPSVTALKNIGIHISSSDHEQLL